MYLKNQNRWFFWILVTLEPKILVGYVFLYVQGISFLILDFGSIPYTFYSDLVELGISFF